MFSRNWVNSLGVVDKSIWENTHKSLRDALKTCRTSLCQCLAEFIDKMMEGGDGLIQRWDNMTNQYASQDKIAGHWVQVEGRQRRIKEAKDLYDNNGCGGGNHALHPRMDELLDKRESDAMPEFKRRWGTDMPASAVVSSPTDWEWWKKATGLTGGALLLYIILSEGSRIIPWRNAIPIL
jgi:hypothetical protein